MGLVLLTVGLMLLGAVAGGIALGKALIRAKYGPDLDVSPVPVDQRWGGP